MAWCENTLLPCPTSLVTPIAETRLQIFPLGKHIIKQLEHDKFTKKVKNKVTILGAIFCQNKKEETKENLKKANKTLDTMAQGYSKYASLAGKYCT